MKKAIALFSFLLLLSCSNDDGNKEVTPVDLLITNISPASGPKNTSVTITGTGFSKISSGNIVTINGKECSIVSNTATQINIKVPPGAGSGKIKVVVGDANAESANFDFVFTIEVTTLAGNGSQSFADGQGNEAKFSNPTDVSVDPFFNVFVADGNNIVRKISPTGLVSTFAGKPNSSGAVNGQGAAASFSGVSGLTTDGVGNVYVADRNNNLIRKITPTGLVSTFVGTTAGFIDGSASFAKFSAPVTVTIDRDGNLYVVDRDNLTIRQVSPSGFVSTIVSNISGFADGQGFSAKFNIPIGITTDASGNVYVADTFNHKIRKISPSGFVTTIAGSTSGFKDGKASEAQFSSPHDVAIDAFGNLYVSDTGNSRIRKITSDGIVSTLAGSGLQGFADGNASTAKFDLLAGITIDSQGNLYVADSQNNRIRKIVID